jgi:type IV secretory pathway VirD2 relaxase
MKDLISLNDILTSSGRYPERLDSQELTEIVKANAEILKTRVNKALEYVGVLEADVSSGFRPSSVNAGVPNAAKKSAHMTCEALDLVDDDKQTLCKLFTREVLEKFDLYREDSDFTKGKNTNWCHLQTRKTGSGRRIFTP